MKFVLAILMMGSFSWADVSQQVIVQLTQDLEFYNPGILDSSVIYKGKGMGRHESDSCDLTVEVPARTRYRVSQGKFVVTYTDHGVALVRGSLKMYLHCQSQFYTSISPTVQLIEGSLPLKVLNPGQDVVVEF